MSQGPGATGARAKSGSRTVYEISVSSLGSAVARRSPGELAFTGTVKTQLPKSVVFH